MYIRDKKSALGELRSATSTLQTVLLSFLHTRIASQEASSLQCGLVSLVSSDESTGQTVADSASLTGETTAVYASDDVELTLGTGGSEGLVDDQLEGVKTEVLVNVTTIDGDYARTGNDANACDRLLTSAGSVKIGFCTGIQ